MSATTPAARLVEELAERRKRASSQRAATKIIKSMKGISASSAARTPIAGLTHNVRIVPKTNPAPNTSAKYAAPAAVTMRSIPREESMKGATSKQTVARARFALGSPKTQHLRRKRQGVVTRSGIAALRCITKETL